MIVVFVLVFIIIRALFLSTIFPFVFLVLGRSQVITLRGAMMMIAGGNILDGL